MSTIRVNKLYGMLAGDTVLKPAKAVYKGSQEIKQMYKGSTLVWEIEDAILEIMDGKDTIGYAGGTLVYQIKSEVDGVKSYLDEFDIVVSPSHAASVEPLQDSDEYENTYLVILVIEPNTSTVNRTITFTVTQEESGKTLSFEVSQSGASTSGDDTGDNGGTEDLTLMFDATYNSETEIAVNVEFAGATGEINVFAQIEDDSGNVISERKDYTILVGVDRIVDTFDVAEMIEPCYVVVYDADSYSELGRGTVK